VEVQSGLTAGLEVALEQPPGMEKDKTQDGPVVPGSKGKLAGNKDTNTVVLSQVAAATNRSGAKQLAGSAATNSTVLPRRTQ